MVEQTAVNRWVVGQVLPGEIKTKKFKFGILINFFLQEENLENVETYLCKGESKSIKNSSLPTKRRAAFSNAIPDKVNFSQN